MRAHIQRRAEIAWAWLSDPKRKHVRLLRWLVDPKRKGYTGWAIGVILLIVAAVAFDVHERQVERHARDVAITQAVRVQHQTDAKANEAIYLSNLKSCRRGKGLRSAVRTDALAIRKGARAEYKFFNTAIRRAKAQSKDPAVSAATSASAVAALKIYGDLQASLPVDITIPPKPPNCLKVITDPNAPAALPHHS